MAAKKKLPLITDVDDLKGKRVIVRASLNVPISDGKVTNYFRVMRAMPTLMHLSHAGARVILIAHIGRDPGATVEPVYRVLKEHLDITYVPSVIGSEVNAALEELGDGQVLFIENVRSEKSEIENDGGFAKKLAALGELYVNDAFPVSHREHASIVGIPKYLPSCFGLTFQEEYTQLKAAMKPKHPALFILGGAKFETKQPLVRQYLDIYDRVFVGGALANDFFVAKGYEVGDSLVSEDPSIPEEFLKNDKLLIPIDVTVKNKEKVRVIAPDTVAKGERILDIGPETMAMLEELISGAKAILWNGPLGFYEEGFTKYTQACAERITQSDAYSLVGGGDTIAAIEPLAINDQFGFLSTAGGAMLDFLREGTLPGIDAVLNPK